MTMKLQNKPFWDAWYKTAKWQRIRRLFLASNPLCEFCLLRGVVSVATVADHKEPHKGDALKFWTGELTALCAPCHNSIKQRFEKTGVMQLGFDVNGRPFTLNGGA